MPRKIKRRKPIRKEELVKARVTKAEKDKFERAAQTAGKNLSDWIRDTLIKATETRDE
jgi:uncharacterized protein (DUF1778 family)